MNPYLHCAVQEDVCKSFSWRASEWNKSKQKIMVTAVANILRDAPSETSTQMHPSLYGESMTWCTCVKTHDHENACSYSYTCHMQ